MSFEEIYSTYYKKVYGYLLSLSHDPNLSEELSQEVFYKALIHIGSFKGNSSLYTWLCSIGKNLYLNYVRKNQNKSQPLEEEISEASFESLFDDREQAKLIYKAVHSLPEPYKEVFMLKIFGELKYKEIADLFQKSESWAKVSYFRAKEKIITMLNNDSRKDSD